MKAEELISMLKPFVSARLVKGQTIYILTKQRIFLFFKEKSDFERYQSTS